MGKTDYFRGQARKQTFALLLVIALTWIRLGIDRLRGKKKTYARYGQEGNETWPASPQSYC